MKEKGTEIKKVNSANRRKVLLGIGSVLLTGVFAAGAYIGFINKEDTNVNNNDIITGVIQKVDLTNSDGSLANVKSQVVRITNTVKKNKIVGSGFFISDGYLVTNSHVVDIKGDITIQYSDGSTSKATLISNDITSDVAVLSVENINALAMHFGNTLNVKIANDLYAVGYAANLEGESSITKGILSARRSIAGIEYLQTDAAINSGFSGGPLLNKSGEVVGMNSLANDNATIGMAISSEALQNIINNLIENKNVSYLEKDRPTNALSSVLKEVGYEIDDLYNEWEFFHEGESKPVQEEEPVEKPYVASKNCNLSTLGVKGYDIGWNKNSVKFHVYLTKDEDKMDLVITPSDKKATYKVIDNENLQNTADGAITIIVTAEDKIHKKEYYIVYHNVKTTIPGLKKVNLNAGITKNYQTNSNVLQYSWSYMDVDGMHIDGYFKVNKLHVDLYVCTNGSQCENDADYVPLKSYDLYQDYKVEKYLDIKLSNIKSLLNEGNYFVDGSAKIYSSMTLVTANQGSFSDKSYTTISQ